MLQNHKDIDFRSGIFVSKIKKIKNTERNESRAKRGVMVTRIFKRISEK